MFNIINPKKSPFFYGWLIVVIGVLGSLMSIPGQTIGISVFTDHLMEALSISRDSLSLAYLIGTVSSAMVLSFAGKLLDRIGSQKFGTLISFFLGLILVGLSFTQQVVHQVNSALPGLNQSLFSMVFISVGFFLLRFLGQGSLTIVSRNLPMKWFTHYRGRINAVAGAFITFGFNGSPKVFSLLISSFGWEGAWRIMGFFVMITGTLLFSIFAKERPEDFGLTQDGKVYDEKDEASHKALQVVSKTLKEVQVDFRFWAFLGIISMFSLFGTGMTFHVVSLFEEAGMDTAMAVSIFLPAAAISVVVNLVASSLSDFFKMKYFFIAQGVGILLMTISSFFLSPGLAVWGLILGNGIAGGLMNLLMTVTWPRFYGTDHLGAISGFAMTFVVAGSAMGPFILSKSLSLFGSYGKGALAVGTITALFILAAGVAKEESPVK